MKKRIKGVAFCMVFLILLGIVAEPAQEAVETKRNTITIWAWDDTFNVKAAKMAAQEYEKTHLDVNVHIITKEREEILSDTKVILSGKAYENLPDVIMIEDYDVQDVLESYEDEFVELTDKIDYTRYVDYKNQLCSKDGKGYGIPFDCGTTALFYRLDIIERAGYTQADMENLTWDRYMEIGKNVYAKTGIPMLTLDPTDLPVVRLIMQSCGSWYVQQDGTTADIVDNEALYRALEIYKELLESNLGVSVNGWNEFISAFQSGQVATVPSGGWVRSSIVSADSQSGKWRIAPIPVVSDNENAVAASNLGGSAWYVLKNSANSQEATDFMVNMFVENDRFMDSLITGIGLIPSLKDPSILSNYDAEDEFFGGQQVTRMLTEMAAEVPTVNYGSKTYELEEIIEDEFQDALQDGNIAEGLKRAQIKAEAVTKN